MKKILKLKWMFASVLVLAALAGCSKDDDDNGDGPEIPGDTEYLFGVKTGTVTYSHSYSDETTATWKLVFDDYGKQVRIEMGDGIQIADDAAQKVYYLFPSQQQYIEQPYSTASSLRYAFIYLGDDAGSLWSYYPGFRKSSKSIAGKTCSVCSWSEDGSSWEWAGWKRITFLTKEISQGETTVMEATSFSESIPASSFSIPNGYTKVEY